MRWSRLLMIAGVSMGLGLASLPADAMAGTNAFSGAWTVSFSPDSSAENGGAQAFEDAALFHNDQMSAAAFAMYGFNTVSYALQGDAQDVFTATMTSATHGTLQWAGRKAGGQITGLLVWTKADGSVHRYTFNGVPYVEEN
jgi:hypothetical protein